MIGSFYCEGMTVSSVSLAMLDGREDNGEYGTIRIRAYYGRDDDGEQLFSVTDDVYGHERDVTGADIDRARGEIR